MQSSLKSQRIRCLLWLIGFGSLALLPGCGGSGGGGGTHAGRSFRLNGAGSSFIDPMMSKWASLYNKEKGVEVNYQSTGSGVGVQQMTKKTVDFGCTDAPMNDNQLEEARQAGGEVVHIPLVMGGVVPAYNLPEVKEPIKFTGQVLADIYLGKIKKWNDPALAKLNEDLTLPDRKILVIYRSEASGTTYIWTDFLSQTSKDWPLGVKTLVEWPQGVGEGAKGSEGLTGTLGKTTGTIGYVEVLYALKNRIQIGMVQNKEGEFVEASLDSVTAAASNSESKITEDLRYTLVNASGKGSYPIAGTTWAVVYVKQQPGKGEELVKFLKWASHEGQEHCADLKYARLPSTLIERIDKKLSLIQFSK
jgi:phosphate transport system substrate-binding protein